MGFALAALVLGSEVIVSLCTWQKRRRKCVYVNSLIAPVRRSKRPPLASAGVMQLGGYSGRLQRKRCAYVTWPSAESLGWKPTARKRLMVIILHRCWGRGSSNHWTQRSFPAVACLWILRIPRPCFDLRHEVITLARPCAICPPAGNHVLSAMLMVLGWSSVTACAQVTCLRLQY